ncbi:hypothetical protein C3R44_22075, partial [Mycobacterium tuberculosis]
AAAPGPFPPLPPSALAPVLAWPAALPAAALAPLVALSPAALALGAAPGAVPGPAALRGWARSLTTPAALGRLSVPPGVVVALPPLGFVAPFAGF